MFKRVLQAQVTHPACSSGYCNRRSENKITNDALFKCNAAALEMQPQGKVRCAAPVCIVQDVYGVSATRSLAMSASHVCFLLCFAGAMMEEGVQSQGLGVTSDHTCTTQLLPYNM